MGVFADMRALSRRIVMVLMTVAPCMAVVAGMSHAQAQTTPHPTAAPHSQARAGRVIARSANVEPGGGCSDPEPEECVEDPKTHCPVKGPLHASGSEECVQIPGTVVNVKGKAPDGGCSNLEVIQVTIPPAGERFEAAWYSEIGLGTRWWQSPGEPSPIVSGAASYTIPAGQAAWSGAGGNGGPGVCEQGIPERTFGVKAWALTSGKSAGGGGGPGAGTGSGSACRVPKLRHLALAKAKRALKSRHCRLGKVKTKTSSASNRGRVISQTVRAGRVLTAGSRVGVTLGR
jgi:PASTA domain